jgi:hypothetical protein
MLDGFPKCSKQGVDSGGAHFLVRPDPAPCLRAYTIAFASLRVQKGDGRHTGVDTGGRIPRNLLLWPGLRPGQSKSNQGLGVGQGFWVKLLPGRCRTPPSLLWVLFIRQTLPSPLQLTRHLASACTSHFVAAHPRYNVLLRRFVRCVEANS